MNEPYASSEDLVDDHLRWVDSLVRGDDEIKRVGATVSARLQATRAAGASLPILWLEDRLALSESEMRVLWALLGHELDPSLRAAIRALNTEQVSDVTFDALRRLVYGPRARLRTWRELGPEGRLRMLGLIERTDGNGDAPEQRQTFKLARRVLALAHGDDRFDPELGPVARVSTLRASLDDLEIDPEVVVRARRAVATPNGIVLVHGRAGSGKRSMLSALIDRPLLIIDAAALSSKREEMRRQLRGLAREVLLLGCVPLIRGIDALAGGADVGDRIDVVESELEGLVLATSARPVHRQWTHSSVQIEMPVLKGDATARLWRRALPQADAGDGEHLATMYPLSPAMIRAAGDAAQVACAGTQMRPEHIEAGIRTVLDHRLAGLATRVNVTQTWDDLVLPDDQIAAIIELLARIRERRCVYEDWGFAEKLGRGLGVAALFSGPPGTGKTMAAGLIAHDLGCELYQVDTSKLTSKWIGETEKNLAALFDAAEAGHAILLFDEADSLFGKRTDVKSSNDRHSNQQVNYLLQRIESYAGICILTTNHEGAIDEAFRRRLSVHVRFPIPEADERKRLWRALLPSAAPVADDLGIDQLAESYAMTGGHIRNAMLRAAFLAADEGQSISSAHLLRGARLEYEGMGKLVTA